MLDISNNDEINSNARDTCLTAQDRYKKYLDYFEINYEKEANE